MPQKSPVVSNPADKAIPVSAIYFGQIVKWPDMGGAGNCLKVDKPGAFKTTNNTIYVESIFEYGDKFVINGQYFMGRDCAYILTWEY